MKKILLVEDEKILVEMYRDKLIASGYEIISVIDSEKALVLVKKEKPDLVVLDILLPKESGIYFLQQLRKDKDKDIASTRVVAFSNFDDPKTKQEAKQLGIEDYLIKTDYTPQQLVEKIKGYLNEK